MKIQIVTIVIFLTIILTVNSSKFYLLEDFKEKPDQTFLLQEKDALLFDLKQGRHALVFERFNTKGGIDIGIYIYQKSYNNTNKNQSSTFLSLKPGMFVYLDFDRDLNDDMQIKYLRQIKNNATLQFVILNQSDINIINPEYDFYENPDTNSEDNTNSNNPNLKVGLSISLGIIILGLLLLFVIKKRKTN